MTLRLAAARAALVAAPALALTAATAGAQNGAGERSVAVRAGAQARLQPSERLAAATIDRAARAVRAARTVRATFEQTLSNPATGNTNVSTGELALARPDRFAVRFNTPAGDRVIGDGRSLWVYIPSAVPGQVLKQPARGPAAAGVDALSELLTSPRSRYNVADAGTAAVGGRATRAVLLTPKREGGPLTQAKVWVDDADGAVRQIELTEATGGVRTWRMTSWVPNARLAGDAFTFTVPSGVRVVDRIQMQGGR
jgi:outer membrane lipoprotein carrier protein